MTAGVFDEFFGVPTHPLAVHAPVVLIPLLAVISVVVLFRSSWRERASVPLAGLALVMVALLFVAKESGQSARYGDVTQTFGTPELLDRHEDLGNQTFVIGIAWLFFALGAGLLAMLQRNRGATSLSSAAGTVGPLPLLLVFNVLAALALAVLTIWLIRTGHAGAESRWKFVSP